MNDFSLPCLNCGTAIPVSAVFVSRAMDLGTATLATECDCGAKLELTNSKAGRRQGFWELIPGATGGNL